MITEPETRRTPVREKATQGSRPESQEHVTQQVLAPHLAAVLDHLYRCQSSSVSHPAYLEDLAAALRIPVAEVRACVERLRDQGLVISTGAETGDPCVCLSLRGLSLAAAGRRRQPAR